MQELDDNALLREYVENDSEEAFATLVTRHVNKVYSVALRHTSNPHQAEEITQVVFVILARKSDQLGKRVVLEGWLYETARLTSLTFIRSEIRRARRQHEACMQTISNKDEDESAVWTQIAPLLDTALASLNETERHALVLRFFYGKSMKEVGATLGGTENATALRLRRAVEKLRRFFLKRGIASTTDIIEGAISAHSVQAAPLALAKLITVVALAKGVTASGSTLTLIEGALKIMAWTKTKITVVVSVGILLATGTTVVVLESQARADRKKDFVAYEIQHQSLMQKLLPQRVSSSETRRQLVGDWMIEAKKVGKAAKYSHFPKSNPHLKSWTLTNWAIVTYDSKSNVLYSASGPYELDGNVYTETVESGTGTMSNYIGAHFQFNLRVEGDKYYQMGSGIEEMGQRVQQ